MKYALAKLLHRSALSLLAAQAAVAMGALPGAAQQRTACADTPLPTLIEGRAFAIDGDTLAIAGSPHIRLWGVQAPELRDKQTGQETKPGAASRAFIEDVLEATGRTVQCRPTKWDRYCRLVAVCLGGADGVDLSHALLTAGFAYGGWLDDSARVGKELPASYATAEATARRDRRGFWKLWTMD